MQKSIFRVGAAALLLGACSASIGGASGVSGGAGNAGTIEAAALASAPFTLRAIADFDDPWAMTFLPDGSALLTEQDGRLLHWREGGAAQPVSGTPAVAYAGQGGFGDVVLHPDFAHNRLVYLSWAAEGPGGKGAVVGRARLSDDGTGLEGLAEIWRQQPFVSGNGHFGHRIAFGGDGKLYISSGERQKFDPAQDMASNLGKIVRLNDDGSIPADNPFASAGGVRAQIWTWGHRNPLGLAFDGAGQLWEIEMGPAGGDELNRITRGANYGYPRVSNGDHYDGRDIPDHAAGDGFAPPALWWNPSISPGGLTFYDGGAFPAWRGSAFIPALGGTALVRVAFDGNGARQADRWDMGFRLRAVVAGPAGSLYLLADGGNQGDGKLYRLQPR